MSIPLAALLLAVAWLVYKFPKILTGLGVLLLVLYVFSLVAEVYK